MFITVVILVAASTAFAATDNTHTVAGTVFTADGDPVARAIVRLTPGEHADTTDTGGRFSMPDVPPGDYSIEVSMLRMGLRDTVVRVRVPSPESGSLRIVMEKRTYRVDEVVVMSDRRKRDADPVDSPSFVTVVERADFENEATTVADVLKAAPGANISVMGGLGDYSEVSLRGSYSNQVQVYIDGMLLNEAVGGPVNLGTIPLTHVESVEIWRSGAPALYGGEAVGGAINIKTRSSRSSRKMVTLGYGSFDTLNGSAVLNFPVGMSRFHVTADFASAENDFRYKSDNGTAYNTDDDYWARRYNDQFRSTNVLGKYSTLFGGDMLLEISDHILSNRKNIPRMDNARYSHASLETTKNLLQAKFTLHPFFPRIVEASPTFHHIYTHERYRDPDNSIGWGIQDNRYDTQVFNIFVPVTVHAGDLVTLSVSPVAKHETFSPESKLQKTLPLSCSREHLAIAGDAEFRLPGDRLTITAAVKRNRYFSSFEGYPSPYNLVTPSARFDHTTNSQAGLKVNLLDGLSVRGNYGDLSRIPSFYELFGDRGGTVANPDLKPERVFRWDAGGRYSAGMGGSPIAFTVELAYFENRHRNFIQWYTTDAGFVHPENVGGSYVKGTETVWNARLFDLLTLSGNWTFQTSKVTEETRLYYRGKMLPNRPKNYGRVKLEYPSERISVFWALDRKGSYYLDRANQSHKRYPGRSLHDAGISVSLRGGRSTCSFLVKNIFDEHTFDVQGMPKPGRSFSITVDYRIGE